MPPAPSPFTYVASSSRESGIAIPEVLGNPIEIEFKAEMSDGAPVADKIDNWPLTRRD
jgi:hypothetical protein